MGDIENKTATKVNSAIGLLADSLETVVQKMIIADVPFLGLPIISQFWEALFNWICGYFVRAAQTGATFAVIDTQVKSEETGISYALSALIAAEKSGNQDLIKQCLKNYAKAQKNLVSADGSATI